MAQMVRKCEQCGATDTREHWKSADEAAKQGVFDKAWTCPQCAWSEFDLVEAEQEQPANA